MNTLRDEHRFLRRRKRDIGREIHGSAQASESYEQFFARLSASDSTPIRKLARAEASATVISSLARLTEDQRNVVELRFLKGWSVAEVAEQLNKSEAVVHMLCHRALKALREVMLSMSRFLSDSYRCLVGIACSSVSLDEAWVCGAAPRPRTLTEIAKNTARERPARETS